MKTSCVILFLAAATMTAHADRLSSVGIFAGGKISYATTEQREETFEVSKVTAQNRPQLLKLFDGANHVYGVSEGGKILRRIDERGQRHRVFQRIDSTHFLIEEPIIRERYLLVTALGHQVADGATVETGPTESDGIFEYAGALGQKITVNKRREIPPQSIPKLREMTQDEFLNHLKAGNSMTLTETGKVQCETCKGRGLVKNPGKPAELTPSLDCKKCDASGVVQRVTKWKITWKPE